MKSPFNSTSSPYSNTSDIDASGSTTMSTKPSSRIFQPIQLKGVELPVLSRYAFALGLLISCIIVLLWSRLDIRETRVALSQAQKEYKEAMEEQHRLQLELDSILAPSTVRGNIQDFNFTADIQVVEIIENNSSAESEDSIHVH